MTRSSGGSSRQPNRPYRDNDSRRDPGAGSDEDFADNGHTPSRSRPARRSAASSFQNESAETAHTAVDQKKRGIALMGDVIVSFGLSLLVVMPVMMLLGLIIPHVTKIVTGEMVIMSIMLVRDYFYQGRGFGKNLMGLQVVDATTGQPPTLIQSVKRNILFFVPLILTGIVALVRFLPLSGSVVSMISGIVGGICTVYVVALIPAECWFAYTKSDGRRIGDKIANTVVVDSSMDFSKPL